jgi:hypothetical protein
MKLKDVQDMIPPICNSSLNNSFSVLPVENTPPAPQPIRRDHQNRLLGSTIDASTNDIAQSILLGRGGRIDSFSFIENSCSRYVEQAFSESLKPNLKQVIEENGGVLVDSNIKVNKEYWRLLDKAFYVQIDKD